MSSRLSNSMFQGRPGDKLLVKDTYEVTTGETRNSIFDTAKGIYSDAIGGLKGNTSSPRDLTELVIGAKQGNMTKQEMLDKALSAMGSSIPSLFGQVGGTLQNVLGDTLRDAGFGEVADLGKILYGAAPLFVKGADVDDVDGLIRIVGELTGQSEMMEFFNLGAEAGILSGIAKQLVRYGIGDLVDDLAEMAHDESVKEAIFRGIIENAINTSDLKSVNKALDKLGADGLLSERPNAIAEILAGYRFPEDFDMRNILTERNMLIGTLIRISPYWTTKLRNGVEIRDYKNWVALGTDAKTLMMAVDDAHRITAISYNAVRQNSVAGVQAELYPAGYVVNKG
jgi:hypothetical protein